jgi:periplasmic protein CpxP/Spy
MRTLRTQLLAATLLAGAAAFAQSAPAPANPAVQRPAQHLGTPRMMPGQFVDGRIAFLKTELAITPAQEAQWQEVAAAMRQNAAALDQVITGARARHGRSDAVERLEMRGEFAKMRADNDARLLAAFKPLYASLSAAQRQKADALFAMEHGRHQAWHRHA